MATKSKYEYQVRYLVQVKGDITLEEAADKAKSKYSGEYKGIHIDDKPLYEFHFKLTGKVSASEEDVAKDLAEDDDRLPNDEFWFYEVHVEEV